MFKQIFKSSIFLLALIFLIASLPGCKSSVQNEEENPDSNYQLIPPTFQKCLDHHGFKVWKELKGLEFSIDTKGGLEHHVIDLVSRNTCVMGNDYSIVKNDKGYFISPSVEAFEGDPVFYHNVYFYFVGMPFVLTDSGIIYETLGDFALADTVYHGIKIQYEEGVGVADKDEYILLIDQSNYELKYLLYTVTYYDQQKSQNWYAKRYDSYKTLSGIKIPSSMSSFNYDDHTIGDHRGTKKIKNIDVSFQSYPSYTFDGKEPSEEYKVQD